MAPVLYLIFGIALLQIQSNALESNTTSSQSITENVSNSQSEDNIKLPEHVNKDTSFEIDKNNKLVDESTKKDMEPESEQNERDEDQVRQKRDFNFNGFPYPSLYPTFPLRNDRPIDGIYGSEDPFVQIHKRLSDIATVIRQPTLPPIPPATRYPLFVPLVYIPHNINCGCIPNQNHPRPQPTPPKENKQPAPNQPPASNQTPASNQPLPTNDDGTVPTVDFPNRGSEALDDRRNWGIITNESTIEDSGDFSRPISFDPIPPVTGIKRPPPPVEHGSVEGTINSSPGVSTTISPLLIGRDTNELNSNFEKPSVCDGAVLTCCHQARVTYDCFAAQGCPDPPLYGNPCDVNAILRVVERFQRFYGSRRV